MDHMDHMMTSMDMSISNTTSTSTLDMAMTMMTMKFTTHYSGIPVLFSNITPTTAAAAFGVWIAIFATAIVYRGLVYTRTYLEAVVWAPITYKNKNNSSSPKLSREVDMEEEEEEEDEEAMNSGGGGGGGGSRGNFNGRGGKSLVQPFSLQRDLGRMLITFITMSLAYALMLVTMTFVVAWFFAVVTGLAVGEFIFARLTAGRAVGAHDC